MPKRVKYQCNNKKCRRTWYSPHPKVRIICPKCGELGSWVKK